MLQIIYIYLCFQLFKIKSWKWILDPKVPKVSPKVPEVQQQDPEGQKEVQKDLEIQKSPEVPEDLEGQLPKVPIELTKIYHIYQREEALFLIAFSFLGIWILMSEISDIFNLDADYENFNFQHALLIIYNVVGIAVIIPISLVLIAVEKEKVWLLYSFYFASLIEIAIIITRFVFIYYYGSDLFVFMDDFSNPFNFDYILYRERIIFGILTALSLIILNAHTFYTQRKLREMKKKGLNLLLAYEPEEPKEFAYDYDPKQEKRDDDDKKESIKTYIYYDQFKKGILNLLK